MLIFEEKCQLWTPIVRYQGNENRKLLHQDDMISLCAASDEIHC
jgi:hypothetical protein